MILMNNFFIRKIRKKFNFDDLVKNHQKTNICHPERSRRIL